MKDQKDKRTVVPNGQRIRELRQAAGYSLEVFAEKLGVSTGTLGPVERGNKPVFVKTLHEIVEGLNRSKKVTTTYQELLLLSDAAPKSSSLTRSVFQLPPSLVDFTGREDELDRIVTRLRGKCGTVAVSLALRGMGGVGKTVTAIKACCEVKDDFTDAQLVLELRGVADHPMTPVEAMSRIIRDFHPETGKLPDEEADLVQLYRQVLTGKKALILLDNAKDEAQVRSLLSAPPPVAFVVTSRNALALDGVASIPLGLLPPDESLTLLRSLVGTKGSDEELREVTRLCGFLPLALRVAGDFLRLHENWPLPKYIDALKDEATRLERLKGKTPDRDVEAVLAFSARELVRETPKQAERWQILSVFPADFGVQAVAAVWDWKDGQELDEETATDELTALLDCSLVQYDAEKDRYSLHDLMRPIARDTFGYVEVHPLQSGTADRLAAAEYRFAEFYRDVLRAANNLYLEGNDNLLRGLALFDREQVNIQYGQAWIAQNRGRDHFVAGLCGDYPNAGAHIFSLRLPARKHVCWLEEAIAAWREIGDRRGESAALGNLGTAWAVLGDTRKAIEFQDLSLLISREIGDLYGEGQALGNLGLAWARLGDARKAIEFYEQSLVIAREIGDRRNEGAVLGNLGLAWDALGGTRKSIAFHERSLAIAREIGDRRSEGTGLGNLGIAWARLGDSSKAIEFYNQRLVIAREIGDRRGESVALGSLGAACYALGNARKAIEFHEQNLIITREIGDRRDESAALGNLGIAWFTLSDVRKAIEFHEQSLVIAREISDRRSEGTALGNLGGAWARLGNAHKAIEFYSQHLAIARDIGDRRGEAVASFNMGVALHALGQPDEAISHAGHALNIFTEIEDPNAATVRCKLAEWCGETPR
jgi:tetratricopeptide (TPR) repeat protein/transcriptional regulator with XRE-family HTH domain